VVHTCVGRLKLSLRCPAPRLTLGLLGDCGKWRATFKLGRPNKRTTLTLRRQVSRAGAALSGSHKFVGLRTDDRITFAGALFETVPVEDGDMPTPVLD